MEVTGYAYLRSSGETSVGGLQADLNAAANIGLRALLDPDFPGKWWYVPCDPESKMPKLEKVKGSILDGVGPLQDTSLPKDEPKGKKRSQGKPIKDKKEIVNLWRDPQATPIQGARGNEFWQETPAYWHTVQHRIIQQLRKRAGLAPE